VSLHQLRDKLTQLLLTKKYSVDSFSLLAVADARTENKLVLVVENSVVIEQVDEVIDLFNKAVHPYEKILGRVFVAQIPRTALGKLKSEELKRIISKEG
jgi:acyl-coenzyme A synthetase/AMP-(fatty) acid ligase